MPTFFQLFTTPLLLSTLAAFAQQPSTALERRGPDLDPKNNIWTETSPTFQVIVGVFDVAVIGGMQTFYQDKSFLEASRKYKERGEIALSFKKKLEDVKSRMSNEEQKLAALNSRLGGLNQQIGLYSHQLSSQEAALEEEKNLLTSAEKEVELQKVNTRLSALHTDALANHRGEYNSLEDVIRVLPSRKRSEFESLRARKNILQRMPEVTSDQKEELVKAAEKRIEETLSSRDNTITEINTVQNEAKHVVYDIERIRPDIKAAADTYATEKNLAEMAEAELNTVVAEKKGILLKMAAIRISTQSLVALDLGDRIFYYLEEKRDPGFSPWLKTYRFINAKMHGQKK